jgi:hypothetical protein
MTDDRKTAASGDDLLAAARGLPEEIAPGRDLWPGIEARLGERDEAPAPARQPRPMAWPIRFAAAAALVAATALVTLSLIDRPAPATAEFLSPEPAMFGAGYDLGAKHQLVRAHLSEDLARHLETLPPETAAVVKRNLAQIREAVAEINRALEKDPGNILLEQLLMAAYQDEMEVLSNVNRMAGAVPSRNEI